MIKIVSQSNKTVFLMNNWRIFKYLIWGCPRGVMVKAMDFGIVVYDLEIQSRYYVHFQTNTFEKHMNPLNHASYGFNSITIVLLESWLWHYNNLQRLICR